MTKSTTKPRFFWEVDGGLAYIIDREANMFGFSRGYKHQQGRYRTELGIAAVSPDEFLGSSDIKKLAKKLVKLWNLNPPWASWLYETSEIQEKERDIMSLRPEYLPGSAYPKAVDPKLVGSYSALTGAGGGLFYDEVLEYRVWCHPGDGDDTYEVFENYEAAKQYSDANRDGYPHAEPPLVLIRQDEWVSQHEDGSYTHKGVDEEPRLTEWQVEWLDKETKRTPTSIPDLIAGNN